MLAKRKERPLWGKGLEPFYLFFFTDEKACSSSCGVTDSGARSGLVTLSFLLQGHGWPDECWLHLLAWGDACPERGKMGQTLSVPDWLPDSPSMQVGHPGVAPFT